MKPGYTILDHPADLGIEAYGATLAEAFEQAAVALTSIIIEHSTVESREQREVEITASDFEQLLVKWLTEILYLYDGRQFVVCEAAIHKLSPAKLWATICGEQFSPLKHKTKLDVKAVTYHQLLIQENAEGGRITVYLDI
ncbi:MAG: archease [Ignavibacteriae bacterium]|nr:archease [Ignavibacteria bacterium]MBI3364659.1 archease [Ignavibacteriota bacterium]